MSGPTTEVRVPGTRIVRNLDDVSYHGDTSTLSASDAKALLDLPARFHHWRTRGGRPGRSTFDKGTTAHTVILETGGRPVVVDAPDWRTAAARAIRAQAYREGRAAVLRHELRAVAGIRAAVRRHPEARALLYGPGESEVSLYWPDPETGVQLRARLDRATVLPSGSLVLVDLKTTSEGGAHPDDFGRQAAKLRYHMAAAHYLAGAVATGYAPPDARFLHVVVEVTEPYPVTVGWLPQEALEAGAALMRKAVAMYERCRIENYWPGYVEGVATISLPGWALA